MHMGSAISNDRVVAILRKAKTLAREYHRLAGKPLGIQKKSPSTRRLVSFRVEHSGSASWQKRFQGSLDGELGKHAVSLSFRKSSSGAPSGQRS
jgi:hypothetical protein